MFDPTTLITLTAENERVRMEPLTMRHYDALAPIALGQGIIRYSPYTLETEEGLRSFIETAERNRKNGERYAFALFDKQKNAYAGSSSYGHLFPADDTLEIGWTWYGLDFQGSGINQATKRLMLDQAFDLLGAHRVEFRVHSQNARSRAAMRKIGGVEEGTLRDHMVMPDGSRRSSVYFSILKPEYAEIRRSKLAPVISEQRTV